MVILEIFQYLECCLFCIACVGVLERRCVCTVKYRGNLIIEARVEGRKFFIFPSYLCVFVQDALFSPGGVHAGMLAVQPGSGGI